MTSSIKETEKLIKMLKKQGVDYFKSGDLELRIVPQPIIRAATSMTAPKVEKISEDDLYYSAGNGIKKRA